MADVVLADDDPDAGPDDLACEFLHRCQAAQVVDESNEKDDETAGDEAGDKGGCRAE